MVKFNVVVDSTCTLPENMGKIKYIASTVIVIDGEETVKTTDITTNEVLELLREGRNLTTSAPSPAEWLRVFNEASGPVLAITLSSELSSSYNNALIASRLVKKPVYVLDSQTVSVGQGLLAAYAIDLSRDIELKEAIKIINNIKNKIKMFVSIKNLSYLAKSGRIPHILSKIGESLGVRPLLEVKDGKIRLWKVTKDPINELLGLEPNEGIIGYTEMNSEVEKLISLMNNTNTVQVSPDVAVHVGPGGFGLAWMIN